MWRKFSARLLILFLFFSAAGAQTLPPFFPADTVFKDGAAEIKAWKFRNGDSLQWARTDYEDTGWETASSDLGWVQDSSRFAGRAWFRISIQADSAIAGQPLAVLAEQAGAMEIYLDGRLLYALGKIYAGGEDKLNPGDLPLALPTLNKGLHVLAVRYSNHNFRELYRQYHTDNAGFSLALIKPWLYAARPGGQEKSGYILFLGLGIFFLTLAFLHLLLFAFYRAHRTNLYYGIFVLLLAFIFIAPSASVKASDPETSIKISHYTFLVLPLFFMMLTLLLRYFFSRRSRWSLLLPAAGCLIVYVMRFTCPWNISGLASFSFIFMNVTISFIIVIAAIRKKKEGAYIVGAGAFAFLLQLGIMLVRNMLGLGTLISLSPVSAAGYFLMAMMLLGLMSIPLSMSVYLARDFARTQVSLARKLDEVKALSEKNLQQEQEKQKILETQKEMLERQVAERTHEIFLKQKELEQKNKDITDSIHYARRIQQTLMATEKYIAKKLGQLKK